MTFLSLMLYICTFHWSQIISFKPLIDGTLVVSIGLICYSVIPFCTMEYNSKGSSIPLIPQMSTTKSAIPKNIWTNEFIYRPSLCGTVGCLSLSLSHTHTHMYILSLSLSFSFSLSPTHTLRLPLSLFSTFFNSSLSFCIILPRLQKQTEVTLTERVTGSAWGYFYCEKGPLKQSNLPKQKIGLKLK